MKGSLKIVAISDTHGHHRRLYNIPDGDVFIHAGDATNYGRENEFEDLADWMSGLEYPYKFFLPGNHDKQIIFKPQLHQIFEGSGVSIVDDHLVRIGEIKIYFSAAMWGYGNRIDSSKSCDLLVTHSPPYGILDDMLKTKAFGSFDSDKVEHMGDDSILSYVEKNPPKVHIFGHVHEHGGRALHSQNTTYYNVAACNPSYEFIREFRTIDL